MARWMALDIGAKRTGIAVTDPLRIIAGALETVETENLIAYLQKYFVQEQVELLVVGEPKQLNNEASQSAAFIQSKVDELHKSFPQLTIKRMDERFTSKMASAVIAQSGLSKKNRERKEIIDTVSATIILQSYMESTQY
jgi:putative holliday junction resolvase